MARSVTSLISSYHLVSIKSQSTFQMSTSMFTMSSLGKRTRTGPSILTDNPPSHDPDHPFWSPHVYATTSHARRSGIYARKPSGQPTAMRKSRKLTIDADVASMSIRNLSFSYESWKPCTASLVFIPFKQKRKKVYYCPMADENDKWDPKYISPLRMPRTVAPCTTRKGQNPRKRKIPTPYGTLSEVIVFSILS